MLSWRSHLCIASYSLTVIQVETMFSDLRCTFEVTIPFCAVSIKTAPSVFLNFISSTVCSVLGRYFDDVGYVVPSVAILSTDSADVSKSNFTNSPSFKKSSGSIVYVLDKVWKGKTKETYSQESQHSSMCVWLAGCLVDCVVIWCAGWVEEELTFLTADFHNRSSVFS